MHVTAARYGLRLYFSPFSFLVVFPDCRFLMAFRLVWLGIFWLCATEIWGTKMLLWGTKLFRTNLPESVGSCLMFSAVVLWAPSVWLLVQWTSRFFAFQNAPWKNPLKWRLLICTPFIPHILPFEKKKQHSNKISVYSNLRTKLVYATESGQGHSRQLFTSFHLHAMSKRTNNFLGWISKTPCIHNL